MMNDEILTSINSIKPTCVGTGLVALDVVISNDSANPSLFLAGGTCGNVLTILSYLGWNSYPVARLSNNVAAELLIKDISSWNVKDDLLSISESGSTPIIIHRILRDKQGLAKHKFEFRNPEDGTYLPSYKPCLAASVKGILELQPFSNVFFFDRINRGAIDLAKGYKMNGAIIFFEPSNAKEIAKFNECLELADVVKFAEDRIPNADDFSLLKRVPLCIQTLGAAGLKYKLAGDIEWTYLKSYQNSNVLDAAGAGDWCTAGIIKSLFQTGQKVEDIEKNELRKGLEFGQALSSLNCTYEGARGLMYSIKSSDLVLYIEHIIGLSSHEIPVNKKVLSTKRKEQENVKISSLFVSI